MFGSLRFRLPALFLLGIVLAGIVATLISIRFFQSYTRARAVDELHSESVGIVELYARQAGLETVPYTQLVHALDQPRRLACGASSNHSRCRARECRCRGREAGDDLLTHLRAATPTVILALVQLR